MTELYIPDVGDIVWLEFNPQAGHEQAGHRPALVLSPKGYNRPTGLMVCCPMTSQIKNHPFEIVVTANPPSTILVDQVKNLDWRNRKARFKEKVSADTLTRVRQKLKVFLSL